MMTKFLTIALLTVLISINPVTPMSSSDANAAATSPPVEAKCRTERAKAKGLQNLFEACMDSLDESFPDTSSEKKESVCLSMPPKDNGAFGYYEAWDAYCHCMGYTEGCSIP